ncbi:Copia protein, partial [Trachymyrmex cornetzi]
SEAIHCAAYILNRMVSKDDKTPFELWFKKRPNLKRIRIFGSVAFMSIPKVQRKKWDERARKLILVGYDPTKKIKITDFGTRKADTSKSLETF